MEIIFKYKGKIISTPNLEKKLKRMKISVDDIKIIDTPLKKKEDNSLEDYMLDKKQIIVHSNMDDIKRVCFISKDKPLPTIKELFKNHIWNPQTKTGIKEITEDYLMTLYYDEGFISS